MVSQEVSIQSYENQRYEWLFGVFGFHQTLDKQVDVTFDVDLQAMQKLPGELVIAKTYDNTTSGLAFFHQSTLKFGALSLIGGIRVDYENATLDYQHYRILSRQFHTNGRCAERSRFLRNIAQSGSAVQPFQ
jgi:iron complex outermembrane recepter protein